MTDVGSMPPGGDGDGGGDALDALARAAQSGDPEARNRFAVRLEALVKRLVRVRASLELIRRYGFEDIVQSALLRIEAGFRRLQVRNEPSLRQWIHANVHHEICELADRANAAKRDARRSVPLGDAATAAESAEDPAIPPAKGPTPEESAMLRELYQLALRALERISPDEAAAVRRIKIAGERISDIARELEVGESTVRMRLTRGLAKIYYAMGRR